MLLEPIFQLRDPTLQPNPRATLIGLRVRGSQGCSGAHSLNLTNDGALPVFTGAETLVKYRNVPLA